MIVFRKAETGEFPVISDLPPRVDPPGVIGKFISKTMPVDMDERLPRWGELALRCCRVIYALLLFSRGSEERERKRQCLKAPKLRKR